MDRIIQSCMGALFISLFLCSSAFAERCEDSHCFPAKEKVSGMELPIVGTTKYRFFGFSIYRAALYGKEGENDGAKVLVLRYDRSISKEDFVESSTKILRRDPSFDATSLRLPMEEFFGLLRSVSSGDEYAMEYSPGRGIALYLNGVLLGRVNADEFARAYLNIWLGEHGIDPDKAGDLLGL